METTVVHGGYIGIMENKMETSSLGKRSCGLRRDGQGPARNFDSLNLFNSDICSKLRGFKPCVYSK